MDSPHIKSSCGTQNKISNPMGIGLGIDYVTWRKILKCIPPTSNLQTAHKGEHGPRTQPGAGRQRVGEARQSRNGACGPAHGANAG